MSEMVSKNVFLEKIDQIKKLESENLDLKIEVANAFLIELCTLKRKLIDGFEITSGDEENILKELLENKIIEEKEKVCVLEERRINNNLYS